MKDWFREKCQQNTTSPYMYVEMKGKILVRYQRDRSYFIIVS